MILKQNQTQGSLENQDVYVGIDVHKRTYTLVAMAEGEILKKWTTAAIPEKVAEQLKNYFEQGRIHTVYEAGFSGFKLHRLLEKEKIESRVVHAASIEVAVHDRVKTDRRDALKMANLLAAKRLGSDKDVVVA